MKTTAFTGNFLELGVDESRNLDFLYDIFGRIISVNPVENSESIIIILKLPSGFEFKVPINKNDFKVVKREYNLKLK